MPVIALSSEPFAACGLPHRLACHLGFELVDLASIERTIAESAMLGRPQRHASWRQSSLWEMKASEACERLRERALEAALAGNVVVHGWTCAAALSGLAGVATVHVQAPWAFRVQQVQARRAYPLAETAAIELESEDAGLRRFMAANGLPALTSIAADMKLDAGRVSFSTCAALIDILVSDRRYVGAQNCDPEINQRLLALR